MGNSFSTTTATSTAPTTSAEVEAALLENALGPASVSSDMGSVTQHSIDDQIKAVNFARQQTAANNPNLGIRVRKIVPPDAV